MREAGLLLGRLRPSAVSPDQMTVRNILLATDFSECSERALSYALGIASRYESRLHLFHCIDPTPYNLVEPDLFRRPATMPGVSSNGWRRTFPEAGQKMSKSRWPRPETWP
jgi:nucleotide-binding universal stress UspA family protein